MQTGQTERISVSSSESEANGMSENPDISKDGMFVVYMSAASNLVSRDNNNETDIFIRDVAAGTTEIISTDSSGSQANNSSMHPSVSGY